MPRRRDQVSTKLWRADDLGGAELLRGRFVNFAYDVHSHDKACFALLTRGAIRIKMRDGEFIARAGDLYVIDAEEPHAGWPIDDAGWSLRTLYVDIAALQARFGGDAAPGPVPALAGPIVRDDTLASLFHALHCGSESARPELERDEHYLRFVARLFECHIRDRREPVSVGREHGALRLARRFLDHHLAEHVHLADIAHAAGLPPFRLYRAFERATGMSPHAYQRQARVRFAAGQIKRGRPLSDVAAESGFADQAHLTRAFRRAMGVTPGKYRDAFN